MLLHALNIDIFQWDGLLMTIVMLFWLYVITCIARFLIFRKMGVAPWKAFIPFYNLYTLIKSVWTASVFWQMSFIVFVAVVFNVLNYLNVFDNQITFYFCLGYYCLSLILIAAIRILVYMQLCKSFKEHVSVWIFMCIFPVLMQLKVGLEEKNFFKGAARFYKKRPLNVSADGVMFDLDLDKLSEEDGREAGVKFK